MERIEKQNKEVVKRANKANIKPSDEVPKEEIEEKKKDLKETKDEYEQLKTLLKG
ncbi:hypothetical protein KKH82_06905 [Patescibacteria group bacterium]|nr:hypothetical protein [Patescibacteria group bacterium]